MTPLFSPAGRIAVIGSGPAREMAAIEAGFLGKKNLLIKKEPILGGATVNTGTIPSKPGKTNFQNDSLKEDSGITPAHGRRA